MTVAPPVLPVLSRIQEITARFAPAPAATSPDGVSSQFASVLAGQLDTAGTGPSEASPSLDLNAASVGRSGSGAWGLLQAEADAATETAPDAAAVSAPELAAERVAAGPVAGGPISAHAGCEGAARFEAMFAEAGARHGVDPKLLAAVARTESNFRPDARSGAGAVGLMQFMPATARSLGIDPTDPSQAIDGAARYLRQQIDRFGSTELAVAAYNAGPGAVSRFGGVPPYSETRTYVTKVLGAYRALG